MRTSRRGLTVIELVLILLAIGILAYFAFRYLGRDEAPDATAALDSAAVVAPAPAGALAQRLELVAPTDSAAMAADTVLVRVRAVSVAGTAVANAGVRFEVVGGNGSVTPDSAATSDLGEAETRWVVGTQRANAELRASVPGSPGATVSVRVTSDSATTGGTR